MRPVNIFKLADATPDWSSFQTGPEPGIITVNGFNDIHYNAFNVLVFCKLHDKLLIFVGLSLYIWVLEEDVF